MSLENIARAVGQGLSAVGNYTKSAASTANGVSAAAQSAQGAFNQGSVNIANSLGDNRLAEMYQFNAAQAAAANNFSLEMWEKMAAFNAAEAQKNRDFQERMDSTKYYRAVQDMIRSGLNPALAVTGGIAAGSPSGSAASVGSAQGVAASGSAINGLAASEGNYSGQMEYMGGILGVLGAALAGMSSASKAIGWDSFKEFITGMIEDVQHPNPNSIAGNIKSWLHRDDWKETEYEKMNEHQRKLYDRAMRKQYNDKHKNEVNQ